MAPGTPPLTLHPVSDPLTHGGAVAVCLVRDAQGHTVGSLKRIGAVWKFKAIGHGPQGELIPGGGPFTHRHNTAFHALDAAAVNAELLADGGG